MQQVIEYLRETEKQAFCLFTNKQLKAIPEKYHLITINREERSITVHNCSIKSIFWEKPQGIKIDD